MTDYASLKVPDLKKLLTERSLPQTGNKADLVARLQENDKSMSHLAAPRQSSLDVPRSARHRISFPYCQTRKAKLTP